MATGIAAGLLTATGFVGLGLHLGDSHLAEPLDAPTSIKAPSSSTYALFPSSTRASVGGRRIARSTLSPEDADLSAFVSAPVEPTPLPADVTIINDPPTCADTVYLTVLELEGCPMASLVGTVVEVTQEAVAPLEAERPLP